MNKFKELLFLSNIKRVGKKKINQNFLELVKKSNSYEDFISDESITTKFSEDKLKESEEKTGKIYNEVVNDSKISVITVFDDNYPKKLMDLEDSKPVILYVKGNVNALSKANLAVIGTRKPLEASKNFERELVKSILNTSDRAIISGLALGCDKIAHETTVEENKITIAVLPSGLNNITPASHKKLAEKIIETGGCLITEYEPNKKAFKGTFIERDNIVAALADINFVMQCGEKSGTMHTVNFTKKLKESKSQYQRELYAYLPDELSPMDKNDDFGGNIKIINEKDGTRVRDIESFCEELVFLDSITKVESQTDTNIINQNNITDIKVKNTKNSKQTTLF